MGLNKLGKTRVECLQCYKSLSMQATQKKYYFYQIFYYILQYSYYLIVILNHSIWFICSIYFPTQSDLFLQTQYEAMIKVVAEQVFPGSSRMAKILGPSYLTKPWTLIHSIGSLGISFFYLRLLPLSSQKISLHSSCFTQKQL